ncbi:hypothetical protein V9T40_009574 [Parthenolecanium corni]|uniref:Uncharacterized protein n=1 Tax=Parthenolecanium corni TaxID=536013 RepID=A0AAN9Y6U6_9HEMI
MRDRMKIFKSYAQRLEEYTYILSTFSSTCVVSGSVSEICNVWSIYLELHLQPKEWRAIWYILRPNCDDLGINFPQIVEVMVENVDFNSLTASVRILNDDNDCEPLDLSGVITNAPLKDLYVTIDQDNPKMDAHAIAEYIDQLRVFFHHLWYPWDADSDCSIPNWCVDNLENRLQMYFDKLLGKVHYITGKKIKHLMERGEELYENMNKYSIESSTTDEKQLLQHSDAIIVHEECFNELELIKMELSKLEISQLRNIEDARNRRKSTLPRVIIVVGHESIAEVDACLQSSWSFVKEHDGSESRIFAKIKDAFLEYSENDTIILCSQENLLNPREHFDFAVNLIGLPERKIVISDTRSHWCLFECLSNDIRISNLAFEVQYVRSVITIKRGCVYLDRVRLASNGSQLPTAIQVYEDASLLAMNCDFSGFDIAIECFGRTSVKLDKCTFRDNNICLKVSSESRLEIFDCDMIQSKSIPIQLEQLDHAEKRINPLSYLSSVTEMNILRCKFADESRVLEVIQS